MGNIPTTIYIAFGAVMAAIITAIISIVSSVITKETKVSELRQHWINELRQELSKLISLVNKLSVTWYLTEDKSEEVRKKWLFEHTKEVQEIDELTYRLRMRLNPEEDGELIRLISCLEKLASNALELESRKELEKTYELYTSESQRVLKREWTKVKDGEDSYRKIIQYSKTVVATSFVFVISLLLIA
ncbi:hypothetical protein L8R84_01230 [Vibrio splendidus]|uniref:hypothetical protein n=1 Tax=Vibrio TaxID=662 RepID=UPI000C852C68|nr:MULTISPECIES: hypothetical protein [Vibrio]MDH5934759.1 hypothetical protein [Vibrio splendidus]PMJ59775.1 hypothetical protein BCU18_11995 [Vibrio lentus]